MFSGTASYVNLPRATPDVPSLTQESETDQLMEFALVIGVAGTSCRRPCCRSTGLLLARVPGPQSGYAFGVRVFRHKMHGDFRRSLST